MKFPEPFKSHIIINNQYDKNYKIYLKDNKENNKN